MDFSQLLVDEDSIRGTSSDVTGLSNNTTYYWRVSATNDLGTSDWSEVWSFTTLVTGVLEDHSIPTEFTVSQNYPNPFNPSTAIRYGLPEKAQVRLEVFNLLGQLVSLLVDGEREAGWHEAVLQNHSLASGLYIYRLSAGDFVQSKKLVLLR